MHSIRLSLAAVLITLSLINAQTSTSCSPLEKSCPSNPGLGTSIFTDFTQGQSNYWKSHVGTTPDYDKKDGMQLTIRKLTDAPTVVMTKYIMFGHVDLVAKASPGTGIISSFVLLSQDLDEVDWEWLGGVNSNVQTNFFGKGDVSSYDRAAIHAVQTPIDTFHTYSVDWTAERTIWLIDGNPVRTLTYNDAVAKGGKIYPQTPMEVKIGNWVGCEDITKSETLGRCQWAGGQVDIAKAPFTMSVKSINVTDYGCGGDYSYSDKSGSWQSIKSSGACDGKGTGPGVLNVSEPEFTALMLEAPPSPNNIVDPAGNPNAPILTSGFSGKAGLTPGSGNQTLNISDANGKPKHTYGVLEFTVVALGLCLGYVVM